MELLLLPLEPVYGAVVRARAAAYGCGLLPSRRAAVPVVSVGNLTFGGTGKTPTVAALARDLVRRGRRPAVLTRGYGRRQREPLVLREPGERLSAGAAGDEPLLLARALPGVPVVVDPDRVRGAARAVELGADVLVLDDGFQHLRLRRDLDLVLVDAGDPWGGGRLPPRGRLREPLTALQRASAVLVTKLPPGAPGDALEPIARRVQELAPGCPVLGSVLEPTVLRTAEGTRPPAALQGCRVFAVAGLGRPEGFVATLEALGAEVVGQRFFPDHHVYSPLEVEALAAAARRLDALPVTTAKDAVKLPEPAPLAVLEVAVRPLEGSWDRLWRLLPEVQG